MAQNLPWFIWRETIDYIVTLNKQYCLMNKEWFAYSSGRFLHLKDYDFYGDKTPPELYKKAEELTLRRFNLSWAFLNECKNLKKISLYSLCCFENLVLLFKKCGIKSVVFKTPDFYLGDFIQILEIIRKTVRVIELHSYLLESGDPFILEYPNVIEFKTSTPQLTLAFEKIQQSMPKICYLSLEIFNLTFDKNVSGKRTFQHMSFLELQAYRSHRSERTDYCEMINNIFRFDFPSLSKLFVHILDIGKALDKMIQSIPKVKFLKICTNLCEEFTDVFLKYSLSLLECLEIKDESNFFLISVNIDFYNLPRLHKGDLWCKFDFINFNLNNKYQLNHLAFKQTNSFPYGKVIRKLLMLDEIHMYSGRGNESQHYYFELTKIVNKLTIQNIDRVIPKKN